MMLDIRNLKLSIPTDRGMLNAVRGVDLQIAEGETLCLVGESGRLGDELLLDAEGLGQARLLDDLRLGQPHLAQRGGLG